MSSRIFSFTLASIFKISSGVTIESCPLTEIPSHQDSTVNSPLIKVFPNPTDGKFTVEIQLNNLEKEVSMKLMNLAGQVVFHKNSVVDGTSIAEKIELNQSIAEGTYIFEISTGEKVYNSKVILMRR